MDDEEDGPDDERLQAMSDQFRYERDLITAEETERWLEDRGLTLDDFNAHFLRHYWADTFERASRAGAPRLPLGARRLAGLSSIAELLLSGELDRMAQQLSWRFAAAHVATRSAHLTPGRTPAGRRPHIR